MHEHDPNYREGALDDISRRFAENLLSEEEFEAALAEIGRASTNARIREVLRRLPPRAPTQRALPDRPVDGDYRIADIDGGSHPSSTNRPPSIVAILGERRHTGRWLRNRYVSVMAILGSVDLDLSTCTIAPDTHIHIISVMAEVRLRIPHGITIANDVTILLSGHTERPDTAQRESGRIRLTGTIVMSELKIVRP